jgi:hypothetical protein
MQCQDANAFIKEVIQLELQEKLKLIGLLWWLWQSRNKIVAGNARSSRAQSQCWLEDQHWNLNSISPGTFLGSTSWGCA